MNAVFGDLGEGASDCRVRRSGRNRRRVELVIRLGFSLKLGTDGCKWSDDRPGECTGQE